MLFVAVAVLTALVYAEWVLWDPLLPDNLFIPLLDLGKITGYVWSSARLYLAIVLSLYGLYAAGYWAIASRQASIKTAAIFGAGAIFCAELVWAYPATAVDVFGYIAHGRLLALHGVNPFTVAPSAFDSDAIVPFLAFPDEPSQYGPVWVLLGDAYASLARGDLLTEVLLYKVTGALAHIGGAAVIYVIALRISDQRMARLGAYLYLWNPLLLWEMVANAHNDGLMMLLGLVGVWLFITRFDLLVLAGVVAGALVKVPITLIGPTLLIGLCRRRWTRAVEGALLAVALAVAVYHPFWDGIQTLTALRRTDLFTASLGSVLRLALSRGFGESDAATIARTTSLSAFAVVAVIGLLLAFRARSDQQLLMAAYVTLLGGLLLATTWFQAWYVVWPLAIGAALADSRRHLEVALLSLGGLLQYFVFIYLWVIGVFPPYENLPVQATAYLAIVGPLIIGVAIRSVPARHAAFGIRGGVPSGEYH
jgi:hypothetical protein